MIQKYNILVLVLVLGFLNHRGNCAEWTKRGKYYSVTHGNDAYMTCTISGDFVGLYDKTDTEITNDGKYKITPGLGSYVLDITDVQESDYGTYKCKDSLDEDEATLEIAIKIENISPTANIAIGFEGKIPAEVYGMPRKKMEWLHNDKVMAILDESGVMIKNDKKRYQVDVRGSLIINKVVAEDKGTYTLRVTTDDSKIQEISEIDAGFKPSITVSPEASYTKTSGQELKLLCTWDKADGTPVWQFTKKGTNTSTSITAGVDDTSLTIDAVSPDNEGKYSCGASNKYGEAVVHTEIAKVIIPAAITSDFKDIKQIIGSTFKILCKASGSPDPTVQLIHSGSVANSSIGSTSIEIVVAKENVGSYKCTADNGATNVDGTSMKVEKTMDIEMLTPPKFEDETTKNIRSAVGLSYSVICSASGNPLPAITLSQDGTKLSGINSNTSTTSTVSYEVSKAEKNDIKDIVCIAENNIGKINTTVKLVEVVKANAPTKLKQSGPAGLKYIVLSWEKSIGAEKYIIYVNDTTRQPIETDKTEKQIQNLDQNTIYNFKVASVNLAGIGDNATIVLKTSDITPPDNVTSIESSDLTANAVLIRWEPPSNVDALDILYRITYCSLNNGTVVECQKAQDQKDNSIQLKNLTAGTEYEIRIAALNQKLAGPEAKYRFVSLEETVTPAPAPTNKKEGMSTGTVAGIIIAIILIVLLVVDMCCCFFNHCGFTHCCVETFCSPKGSKYQPTDSKEKDEEVQELKPPKKEDKEDMV